MAVDLGSYDYWPGLRSRFEVRIRTWAGTVTIGQVQDPFAGLAYGKTVASEIIMSGKGWSILAVEVIDAQGTLVLGEEAEALSSFLKTTSVADVEDSGESHHEATLGAA